jgi:hypothetical protein
MLERLRNKIFKKQTRMEMGSGVTMHELVEIQDSSEENKKSVSAVWIFFEIVTKVGQTIKNP